MENAEENDLEYERMKRGVHEDIEDVLLILITRMMSGNRYMIIVKIIVRFLLVLRWHRPHVYSLLCKVILYLLLSNLYNWITFAFAFSLGGSAERVHGFSVISSLNYCLFIGVCLLRQSVSRISEICVFHRNKRECYSRMSVPCRDRSVEWRTQYPFYVWIGHFIIPIFPSLCSHSLFTHHGIIATAASSLRQT